MDGVSVRLRVQPRFEGFWWRLSVAAINKSVKPKIDDCMDAIEQSKYNQLYEKEYQMDEC